MLFFQFKKRIFSLGILITLYASLKGSFAMERIMIVDVFTQVARSGNPAAIVRRFPANTTNMQLLSKRLNLPVTVFINKDEREKGYVLRFFAPDSELKMCGHGSLAAAYALLKDDDQYKNIIVKSAYGQDIELQREGETLYNLTLSRSESPKLYMEDQKISKMLNIDYEQLKHSKFKPWIGSIGSPKLFVPLKSREGLANLIPNFEKIKDWSLNQKVNGLYVYTNDVLESSSHLCARSFNPISGQKEDAATGVAVGALGPIMHDIYSFPKTIRIEQGDFLDTPCRLYASIEPTKVKVGGGVIFREEVEETIQ